MKTHIKIKNSFNIWKPSRMRSRIRTKCDLEGFKPKHYWPYIIEWWAHNIGYYLTKPFVKYPKIKALNDRFRDVDLMVERKDDEG